LLELGQLVADGSEAGAGKEGHDKQHQGDGAKAWAPAIWNGHDASIDGGRRRRRRR
jgi:hypothetical protein